MARFGSSHLKDIDEKFCQCSICLQQYREPKLLPCLHRYCSDCLKQHIERNQGVTVISCPECRDEVTIPTEGVDGFKTDFYMKNIIEYIHLQEFLEDEKLRDCYGCSKKLNVTSYCFKCNGFLCRDCHEYHMISKSLKEHKQHVLSLEDLKSKQMTLEKLSDLKEAPGCQSHLNDLCLLCCRTCNELPICVACVHGMHKNHDITDVKIIAAEGREKLQDSMKNLIQYENQYRDRMLKVPQEVGRFKKGISSNLRERKENFTTKYERNIQNVKDEIRRIEVDYKRSETEIENNKERELTNTRKQMDKDMKQIKIKYNSMLNEIESRGKVILENLRKEKAAKLENSRENLATLEREYKRSMHTFAKEQEEGLAKLDKISQQIVGIMRRYENLKATSHSVLETRNDWTAVQCIPDICKAIEPLIGDMEKGFPEFDELSKMRISFEIEESEKSPVNIEGINTDEWTIGDITCVSDDIIVITGRTSANSQSHITAINMSGKVLHQKQMKGTCQWAFRFCAYLSESKIATVCWFNEIGVFDVHEYSYIKKNISDVISSWPSNMEAMCVATDVVNNLILVGSYNSRDVSVFDDELNYHHTLTLPEMIRYPRDMAFSEGKLIVCDSLNKRAYLVIMEGQEGELTHELTKPDCDREDWDPLNVCTDSNQLIYILWMTGDSFTAGRRVIVQYTQDGSKSLRQKEIDSNDVRCIATANTNSITDKLLAATHESAALHIYKIF